MKSDIGLIGLAVMGQNLALNIADHGFAISVYNRTFEKTEDFLSRNNTSHLRGFKDIKEFVDSLATPRKIIIMVQAGFATDAVIEALLPFLDSGDVIIDGGNAKWTDTIRREKELAKKDLLFVGSGVSGGEEGARFGPSLMPGCSKTAWESIKDIWTSIAAKVDPVSGKPITGGKPGEPVQGGEPCAAYVGPNGAGHYVKMVHNGIEYGDMQMICEAYHILSEVGKLKAHEIGKVFEEWNTDVLDSFLIEITADILQQTDPKTGNPFVEMVLDTAGQKGTGKWTSVNALDMGIAAPTIAEAVFARCLSAIKKQRKFASKVLKGPKVMKIDMESSELINAVKDALYCSKICSYAQGFQLMQEAENEYGWKLNFGEIAQIWRGGCIIRAAFLQKITIAFDKNPELDNLLLDEYFTDCINNHQENWRKVISMAVEYGIPTPTFSSALSYFDGYRSSTLPQNLLQAQRDYFGSHSYERIDEDQGKFYHLDWLNPQRPQISL